ncbi:hypothetical protein EYF80_020895 [Liparis tanakae]|uniref:Uncharacterized protein n=1 Tax=Liparis tanakae TaxID=230148 RepID=A0A4Z2HT85_9TELE|nr:hypothetical protein EYF80_020895 [Liparis tanakae]
MESGVEQEQSSGQSLDRVPSGRMRKSRKGISGVRRTFMMSRKRKEKQGNGGDKSKALSAGAPGWRAG